MFFRSILCTQTFNRKLILFLQREPYQIFKKGFAFLQSGPRCRIPSRIVLQFLTPGLVNIACAAKSSSTWRVEKCSITDVIAIFTTNLGLAGRASATAALRDDPHHPRVRLSSRDADRDLLSVMGFAFVFASLSKSHPPP